jgi:hypothetical protein
VSVVRVRVVVLEDNVEVGHLNIAYYEGQEYIVQIVTPDGVDASLPRKAGLSSVVKIEGRQG